MQINRKNATASSARCGNCAISPATIPVSMSPVPPVAIPGLPVGFTQTVPSGAAISVRCPLSTTISLACSRANFAQPPGDSPEPPQSQPGQPRHLSRVRSDDDKVRPAPFSLSAFLQRHSARPHRSPSTCNHRGSPDGAHKFRGLGIARDARTNRDRLAPNQRVKGSKPAPGEIVPSWFSASGSVMTSG
jgi:hypothetical protein